MYPYSFKFSLSNSKPKLDISNSLPTTSLSVKNFDTLTYQSQVKRGMYVFIYIYMYKCKI